MKNVANKDVRARAKSSGVFMWQIAEELGMADSGLSRAMRKELPKDCKERIFAIIDRLSGEAV